MGLCDRLKNNQAQRKGTPVTMPAPKRGLASVFWVGEQANADNGGIHNHSSAWDAEWEQHYHTGEENPFYIALPYNDIDDEGSRKPESYNIPWFPVGGVKPARSICKNRWIEVRNVRNNRVAYGQLQDVGPFGEDDFAYVFGSAPHPQNQRILGAGIDLSPDLANLLGIDGSGEVEWRHVDPSEVPAGPWTLVVTVREGPAWAR